MPTWVPEKDLIARVFAGVFGGIVIGGVVGAVTEPLVQQFLLPRRMIAEALRTYQFNADALLREATQYPLRIRLAANARTAVAAQQG